MTITAVFEQGSYKWKLYEIFSLLARVEKGNFSVTLYIPCEDQFENQN